LHTPIIYKEEQHNFFGTQRRVGGGWGFSSPDYDVCLLSYNSYFNLELYRDIAADLKELWVMHSRLGKVCHSCGVGSTQILLTDRKYFKLQKSI